MSQLQDTPESAGKLVSNLVSNRGGLWRHRRSGRWYWRVVIEGRRRVIPLVPRGGRAATRNRGVAEACRRRLAVSLVQGVQLARGWEFWLGQFAAWNRAKSGDKAVQQNQRVARRFVDSRSIRAPHEIGVADVQAYLADLRGVGRSDRTVQAHRNALRLLCRYLVIREQLDRNPVDAVPVRAPAKLPPRFLTDRMIDVLLRRVDRTEPRIAAAVRLALFAGPRLSSLRALRWEHVGPDVLTVPLTKTRGYTSIALRNPYLDPRLAAVVAGMAGDGSKRSELVFPVHGGRWWNDALKRVTRPLPVFGGRGGRVGDQWHLLRETWAVCCARRGATLWQLMSDGGWRSPQTVMRYVDLAHAAGAG